MRRKREARLRPEYADLYPYLTHSVWESAAVLSDRVVAHTLGRPDGHFISGDRALDPVHFEFRGIQSRPKFLRSRRDDAEDTE